MTRTIMTRAWEIYRTLQGDHTAKLSMALRQAWSETRKPKLVTKAWTHPRTGEVRHYINNLDELVGLTVHRYNTGNISAAYLNGDKISNADAGRVLGSIASAKAYIVDGKVSYYAPTGRYADLVLQVLRTIA